MNQPRPSAPWWGGSWPRLLQVLRRSLPFGGRAPAGLPRGEMLALRPVRDRAVTWASRADGDAPGASLRAPRRDSGIGRIVARILRAPRSRTIELDEFGAAIWDRCDGAHTVEQLVRLTSDVYRLNRRQAEVSVVTFLRMLAQRGLVGLQTVEERRAPDVKRHRPGRRRRRR